MSKRLSALVVSLAALSLAVTASIAPAQAAPPANAGLYGASDPTYDGVFRQALALMGLAANNIKPAKSAITWLLDQQCADGSFQSYRGDTATPCTASDPVTFSGPDVNSTAIALLALKALNKASGADAAMTWLTANQNKDGGWSYYLGSQSDANSTGLALAAVKSQAPNLKVPAIVKANAYLSSIKLSCASGGGLAYQKPGPANASATAQAFIGLTGGLPASGPQKLMGNPTCGASTAANAGSYLANQIMKSGAIASSFGAGSDYGSTAFAVNGFVASQVAKKAVAKATATLIANAKTYTVTDGKSNPGALGHLLMVAAATGKQPTAFGGVNLVTSLQASER